MLEVSDGCQRVGGRGFLRLVICRHDGPHCDIINTSGSPLLHDSAKSGDDLFLKTFQFFSWHETGCPLVDAR